MKVSKLIIGTMLALSPAVHAARGTPNAAHVTVSTMNATTTTNLAQQAVRDTVGVSLGSVSVGSDMQTALIAALAKDTGKLAIFQKSMTDLHAIQGLDISYKSDAARIIAMQAINNEIKTDEFSQVNVPAFLRTVAAFSNQDTKRKALKLISDISKAAAINMDLSLAIGVAKSNNNLAGKDICAACPDACRK